MPRKPTADEVEADRLFLDSMRRVLSIPADEARAICERTGPAKPRRPPLPAKRPKRRA